MDIVTLEWYDPITDELLGRQELNIPELRITSYPVVVLMEHRKILEEHGIKLKATYDYYLGARKDSEAC